MYNYLIRRRSTGKFKAKVVLEILKEEKTVSETATHYEIHPHQLYRWKRETTDSFTKVLEGGRKNDKEREALEKKTLELYTESGKLTTQLNWLKKIWHS